MARRRGFNRDREGVVRNSMARGDFITSDAMARGLRGGRAALARQAARTLNDYGSLPFSEGLAEAVSAANREIASPQSRSMMHELGALAID